MKALGVDGVPAGGKWHCEIKFDGYRAVAVINRGKVELWSRNAKPLAYPEVLPPLEKLKCRNAVVDGEIVALDAEGRSNFQALQGRDLGERPPIVYFVFDLLHLDGVSCVDLPFEKRRDLLTRLLRAPAPAVRLSPVYDVDPQALLEEAARKGLEGIILKRADSAYEPDRRSGAWLKVKNVNEQEFVIGGFTPPRNSRVGFGAILIGHYRAGKLIYAGKVGTGYNSTMLRELHARFLTLRSDTCPFANLPLAHKSRFGQGMTRSVMRTVTWLKPKLVAQVKFTEWTTEGILRHPVFLGLRHDKPAKLVRREAGAAKKGKS
ncbi:MAG TPA: non-homologous end-joining DNA ligase [Lacunisphaera sp.]|nr:non-homologous end-joining DNA ligase [Lacunisphaera sp.]